MAAHSGRRAMSLYTNGCGEYGDNRNFTFANWYEGDSLSGDGCFIIDFDTTSGWQGSEYIEVDTSKYYYHSVTAKTSARSGTTNQLSGGHLGFACYDKNYSFIDLRNCGDVSNAYLTRPANPGDSSIFVDRAWFLDGATYVYEQQRAYFRQILFYPPTHPDYGQPHRYTRLNNRSVWSITQTAQGDYEYKLSSYNSSGYLYTASTLPDYGYALPAGTPISRGVAGGTYNYCHGAPNYPDTEWGTYTTSPFTGENRNSGTPFRYGTKYIRFLNLANYNVRSDSGRPRPQFMLDNIMLHQAKPPPPTVAADYRAISSKAFRRERLKWKKKR
jgi:hypothetical protein